ARFIDQWRQVCSSLLEALSGEIFRAESVVEGLELEAGRLRSGALGELRNRVLELETEIGSYQALFDTALDDRQSKSSALRELELRADALAGELRTIGPRYLELCGREQTLRIAASKPGSDIDALTGAHGLVAEQLRAVGAEQEQKSTELQRIRDLIGRESARLAENQTEDYRITGQALSVGDIRKKLAGLEAALESAREACASATTRIGELDGEVPELRLVKAS
ncbi:MAG TPA: hypothetical protein VI756_17420, partial [Blastocatellia bacterium]